MYICQIALLCFGLMVGSGIARDHKQFLLDVQQRIRDEVAVEEFEVAVEEFEDYINELQKPGTCSNGNNSCSCCKQITMGTNVKVCGNASFEDDTGVTFKVTANGTVMGSAKITGANPPPICKAFEQQRAACVTFHDVTIDLKGRKFSGSANVELKQGSMVAQKFKLGHFQLPPKQKYWLLENRLP